MRKIRIFCLGYANAFLLSFFLGSISHAWMTMSFFPEAEGEKQKASDERENLYYVLHTPGAFFNSQSVSQVLAAATVEIDLLKLMLCSIGSITISGKGVFFPSPLSIAFFSFFIHSRCVYSPAFLSLSLSLSRTHRTKTVTPPWREADNLNRLLFPIRTQTVCGVWQRCQARNVKKRPNNGLNKCFTSN